MKTKIIAMLAFPRQIIRGHVPLETYEHAENFSSSDTECLECETRLECEWLYCNDELAALTEKPLDVVADALASAVLYVDACLTRAGHNQCAKVSLSDLRLAEAGAAAARDRRPRTLTSELTSRQL